MTDEIRYSLFETRDSAVEDLTRLFTIFQNDINPADVSDWISAALAFSENFDRFRVFATDALIAMQGGSK